MKIPTRVRYAARILVHLTTKGGDSATQIEISEATGVTKPYVDKLLQQLRHCKMVKSVRGRKGGYKLGKKPESVTVAKIYEAMEGPFSLAPCQVKRCPRKRQCPTVEVWQQAAAAAHKELAKYTLSDLAKIECTKAL
ncbi:MAG: Rrf2 family transcriptional regulator [Spartobacteria bacterium]|nr:Rrf2 family transcriptional regulator [Spartobacteria bacterium]